MPGVNRKQRTVEARLRSSLRLRSCLWPLGSMQMERRYWIIAQTAAMWCMRQERRVKEMRSQRDVAKAEATNSIRPVNGPPGHVIPM